MAKKYRRKDKDGHEIVTSIYYGNGFSRTTPEGIAELLNGKTPEQHCAMHIAKKGKGSFETKSVEVDICNLPYSNYFHGEIMGREFEYYYDTCEEIEFTGTKNGKPTTVKELMELKGGERIAIRANQRVVWNVPSNGKLIDTVIGEDSVAFTVPKDSMFAVRMSAEGVCDPDAEKYVIIGVNSKTFKPVEHEEPVYQMVIRSPQDIHDIIKVSSTEVAMAVKDEDERKRQARGVIDTILNRIYLEPSNNVRKVLNA